MKTGKFSKTDRSIGKVSQHCICHAGYSPAMNKEKKSTRAFPCKKSLEFLFGLPFVVKFVPIYSFRLEHDCYDGKVNTRPNTNSMGKRHFRLALKPVISNARPFIPALSSLRERKRDVEFNLVVLGTTGALGSADLEAVLEATVDILEVAHSAGAGGLSSLGLLAPVVCC